MAGAAVKSVGLMSLGRVVRPLKLAQSAAQLVLQAALCLQLSGDFDMLAMCLFAMDWWQGIFCIFVMLLACACIILLHIDILAAVMPCKGNSSNSKQAKKYVKRFNINLG